MGPRKGALLPNDRKLHLPEIRNPNLESQGSGGGSNGGDFRSLILFTFLALAGVMVYQYFRKPEITPPAQQTQQAQQQSSQSTPTSSGANIGGGGSTSPSRVGVVTPAVSAELRDHDDL